MIALALILSFLGFLHLSLTIKRHAWDTLGGKPSPQVARLLQCCGWLFLALSVVPCLQHWPWSLALTAWLGLITVSSLAVMVLHTYRPTLLLWSWRWLSPVAWSQRWIQRAGPSSD